MNQRFLRWTAPVALAAACAVACQERPANRADRTPGRPERHAAKVDDSKLRDAGITARIDTAYMVNPHLSADGVRDVHDRLGVTHEKEAPEVGREPSGLNPTFGQAVKDATITASVKMQLATGKGVSASNINVDTRGGHVTLTGLVPTEAERQLAVRIARDTDGVRDVTNQIQVTRS